MANASGTLAYMTEPGRLELRSYEVPQPAPGAVVMRVLRANVCGSELHIWNGKHPQKKSGGLGHEMVGVVEALGDGRTVDNAGQPLRVGDRIVAPYFQTCERCFHCVRGEWNLCDNAYEHYTKSPDEWPHFHTSYATHYYIAPRQYVYKVREDIPEGVAASANCALAQVLFGLDQVGFRPDETVMIQGAGGLGLYATAILAHRGNRVIVVDGVASRLELAKRFGAHETIDIQSVPDSEERRASVLELTGGRGPDGAVELTGVPAAFAEGLATVRRGGTYLVMGNLSPGTTVDYDPGLSTRRALTVRHVDRYEPRYLRKALAFLEETIDVLPYDALVDATFPLEGIEDALNASARREVTRAAIIP